MKPKRLTGSTQEDATHVRRGDQKGVPVDFPVVARKGRIGVQNDPRGAIGVDPVRGQFVRVGGGLAVETGSPYRIVPVLGPGVEVNDAGEIVPSLSRSVRLNARRQLIATPTTAEVSDPDEGGTVQQTLARKANVADDRFPVLTGRVTLVGGLAVVLDDAVVSDSIVLHSHGDLSGTQGLLHTSVSDGGFSIISASATDASVVHYAVWSV